MPPMATTQKRQVFFGTRSFRVTHQQRDFLTSADDLGGLEQRVGMGHVAGRGGRDVAGPMKTGGGFVPSGLLLALLEVSQRMEDLSAQFFGQTKLAPHSGLRCAVFRFSNFFWAASVFSTSLGGSEKSSRMITPESEYRAKRRA